MTHDLDWVLAKLQWMESERIWPNGLRYLWTDAFGAVLLVSLYHETGKETYLDQAKRLVAEVERVLGRPRGMRIGEEPDRDGQYYHYLMMWVYALDRLGKVDDVYRRRAIELVRQIHRRFVRPGIGIIWKMREDLSGPYPGYGLGALDAFDGYVAYRLLDSEGLASEIAELQALLMRDYRALHIDQDLGLGMMLWLTHFFPNERWAQLQKARSLAALDVLWHESPGFFRRQSTAPQIRFAFTNYGVSLGLQAIDAWPERVAKLNSYFDTYRSGDEYDRNAITHVMACTSQFPGEFVCGALATASP